MNLKKKKGKSVMWWLPTPQQVPLVLDYVTTSKKSVMRTLRIETRGSQT